jgi:hypothetical protein
MKPFLIRIDKANYIQRHFELWAKTMPRQNLRTLTPQQKIEICSQVDREFTLTAEESVAVRGTLLGSRDSALLLAPFVGTATDSQLRATVNVLMAAS